MKKPMWMRMYIFVMCSGSTFLIISLGNLLGAGEREAIHPHLFLLKVIQPRRSLSILIFTYITHGKSRCEKQSYGTATKTSLYLRCPLFESDSVLYIIFYWVSRFIMRIFTRNADRSKFNNKHKHKSTIQNIHPEMWRLQSCSWLICKRIRIIR